jgi:uncharacterized protein YbjT (DUF2867 family)
MSCLTFLLILVAAATSFGFNSALTSYRTMLTRCAASSSSVCGDARSDKAALEGAFSGAMKILSAASVGAASSVALSVPRANADASSPVVVLGSNGQTGKLIVQLLAKDNVPVRPTFARTPPTDLPSGSSVLDAKVADVTNIDTLTAAVAGASAVIFASSASRKGGNAEKVDFLGVKNIAEVCLKEKIPKLVVISSGAVTRPKSLGFKITNLFGGIMGYKLQGEDALRAAYANSPDLSYAIIRPGGLLSGAAKGPAVMELNQKDTISGEVNRADVAEVAVAAAMSKVLSGGKKVTFEVYEAGKSGPLEDSLPKTSGFEIRGDRYEGMFDSLKEGIDRV